MARTVRDEINYPCPHFEGCIVEVLVLSSFLLVNGGPWKFGIGIRLVKQ